MRRFDSADAEFYPEWRVWKYGSAGELTRPKTENIMMKAILFGIATSALLAIGGPARAEEYPYCLKNDAGAGDCKYTTYEQCLASLSGRDGYCQRDPYFGERRR